MRIAVSYDIGPDRRRRRLYRVLSRFLDRVQYSVFCGDLDRDQERRLTDAIISVIAPEDDVRIFNLSRGDERRLGRATASPAAARAIVVA
ncbi:MAG: CRISPR-associated endonuclease Cas2 [Planctomycetota bacterium]|nr:CRISPR-associated endonuclease Cas2 [Planctomycetota bacterium]MCX8039215.1 CRISPR-associated endonuclease Cas2 [Planctomycetota bacterium]